MKQINSVHKYKAFHLPLPMKSKQLMTRCKRNILHQHRVVLIYNDIWKRWIELRKNLNLDSNSKLAEILIDTWYGRTESYTHLDVNNKDSLRYSNFYSYCLDTTISQETLKKTEMEENVIPKTEDVSMTEFNHSKTEEHSNLEIDDCTQFANKDDELVALSHDKINSKVSEERVGKRVQTRGVRCNYASMEWNETGQGTYDKKEEMFDQCAKVESKIHSFDNEETFEEKSEDETDASDSSDPDFQVNDAEMKGFNDNELCSSELKEFENMKSKKRKNQGRKRKSENNAESGFSKTKKPRQKKNQKEKKTRVEKVEPKPWIHIKLEDHSEKYRMECVGSFERKNRNSNVVEELYTCLLCGRFKSTAKEIFEEHIEKHVNQVLECNQCSYVGRSEIEVMRHKMSHGHMNKGQEYMCDICGIVLYSWDSRLSHMGKVHNDPRFKCRFCGDKFITRLKRQQHTRSVHADVSQYCNICKADFQTSTAEEFKEHQTKCKPGHPCQVCGVVLASKNGLNNHLKATHMGVRKYQCHMCQYAGKSAQRLREHIMTHTSDHPYSCDKCSFTCVQACQLKSHQRTHTGDKPYKCTQCNFAAAWNVQLKEHLKVHYMDSAVICQPCNILFKNDKARKMHEKKDHYYTI